MIGLLNTTSVGNQNKKLGTPKRRATFAVEVSGLQFSWKPGSETVLDIADLKVQKGDRVFIQGPSGSGKSTLLSLLAGIVLPSQGSVTLLGRRIDTMTGAQRDRFRADHIGFIFQMFNLIPYLSVIENVTLPSRFSQQRNQKARRRSGNLTAEALRLLDDLNMADPSMLIRPVTDLSVGQQQRVAAARALMGAPELVIADEPTSSLDADHRQAFIQLLFQECERAKSTVIFVSHDTALAELFNRTVRLTEINQAEGSMPDTGYRMPDAGDR